MINKYSSSKPGLGWIPDTPDIRDGDHKLSVAALNELAVDVPSSVDLRRLMPPVWDQGSAGSCTGFAGAALHYYLQGSQDEQCFIPSPMFIYYNARLLYGATKYDIGATIRDTMKVLNRWGVCKEQLWPYEQRKITNAPPKTAYRDAEKHQARAYRRLDRGVDSIRLAIATDRPVIFGFSVYSGFISDEAESTGYIQIPHGESMLGGHATVAVGYLDEEARLICRNSWGAEWGDSGYFYLPYDYIADSGLSDDFWTLDLIE